MPSRDEITRALTGVLLLARMDRGGMGLLDLSIDGFWKSFVGPVLAAPAFALLLAERYTRNGLPGGLGVVVPVEALSYAIGCLAFPVAAILLTRLLGLSHRYVPLVVAVNWSTVPQLALLLAAILLAGLLPGAGGLLLPLAGLATLAYAWFVIRTSLETTGSIAFGLVVVDLLLGIVLNRAMDGLMAALTAQP